MCLGEWADKLVAVKIFLGPRSARRHCDREIKGINALKNAGIKTPALLLQGNLQQDDTPVLVFQRVMPAFNPQEVFDRAETDEKRNELLKRIAVVIARQHEAGIKQNDLHLGNLLINNNDIYTIDGDTVDTGQMGTPLAKLISLKNLGLYFAQFASEFDHLFSIAFQAYTEKRSWPSDSSLFNQLLKEVQYHRNYGKRNYLHKIFRECTAFVCHKAWNSYMVCDRNFYHGEMKRLLSDPDSAIGSSRLLKDGNSSTVALVEINNKLLVVKRHNIKNFMHALKRSSRNTR
ncbi:MAG: hypothetical protein KKE90_13360, partial [Actinobacteria bacterium]|nr:hypothetical protein [Actinomycetota bacterium]